MSKKSISGKDLSECITSDDILGKDVIDTDGHFVGVVEKVLIDSNSLDFIGIDIDKGFLNKGLSVGRGYIDRVTKHAVFLNGRMAYEIKGMTVFDVKGSKVGIVSEVELYGKKNKIKELVVKKGIRNKVRVSRELIETIGRNVLLNVDKKELSKFK